MSVSPAKIIPSNLEQLRQCRTAIGKRPKMRIAIIMHKPQIDFCHLRTTCKGDVDQFAVVSPAIQTEQRKYSIGSVKRERFQATLCIPERQRQNMTSHQIKDSARDAPMEWLPAMRIGRGKPPRSDSDVDSILQGSNQSYNFSDRVLQICIAKDHNLAARDSHTVTDSRSFSTVGKT